MSMERRDRQDVNLFECTQATHSSGHNEHRGGVSKHNDIFPNRWDRIGLVMYKTKPNHILRSPVREIRMRGSVRVLPPVSFGIRR